MRRWFKENWHLVAIVVLVTACQAAHTLVGEYFNDDASWTSSEKQDVLDHVEKEGK